MSATSAEKRATREVGDLRAEAEEALGELRAAMSRLINAVPGGARRAVDLQRGLGLDYRLAWQAFAIAQAESALEAGQHVPSAASVRRLVGAAREAGVGEGALGAVTRGAERFEKLVAAHAEDRKSFEAMVHSLAEPNGDGEAAIALGLRRTAYRTNSAIWGVQVGLFWTCLLARPGTGRGTNDHMLISAKLGLRRLRADAPVLVERTRSGDDERREREAVDKAAFARHGVPLMPDFCSRPTPKLRATKSADGWNRSELASSAVGRASSVDLVFASRMRDVKVARGGPNNARGIRSSSCFVTPAETTVMDMLVHRDLLPVTPSVRTYTSVEVLSHELAPLDAPTLPGKLPVTVREDGSVDSPDVPRAAEIVGRACEEAGWDPREFVLYRVRQDYPVLHSVVWFQLDFGE